MADCCEDKLFKAANWLWSFLDENAAYAEREKHDAARKEYNIAFHKYMNCCVERSHYGLVSPFGTSELKPPVFSDFFQPCDTQKNWETALSCMKIAGGIGGLTGFAAFQSYMFSKIKTIENKLES